MDEHVIQEIIGEYGWIIITAFVMFIGRSTIESIVESKLVILKYNASSSSN